VVKKAEHNIRLEGTIPGGRQIFLDFRWGAERLPGILLVPEAPGPVPAALLLHGFTLDKERMSASAGTALLRRGIASLALDLPLHGERFGSLDPMTLRNPIELVRRWRAAVEECGIALQYLRDSPQFDGGRISLVGYSLGSFLGLKVAAENNAVRNIVLAAAGDIPDYVPFANVARMLADPLKLVGRLSGRPILMVHGRYDRTIPPQQAERLFAAACEPKSIKWWDAGHILPPAAIDDAAQWLANGDARKW
jgi:uncharacterized protein